MLTQLSVIQAQFNYDDFIAKHLHGTTAAINAYQECCGRYAHTDRIALYWEGPDGQSQSYSFAQLDQLSAQLAQYFLELGIKPGQCVAGLLGRRPELLITILATWRIGAVYQPLFTAFESKAIEHRLHSAQTKVVVSDRLERHKLDSATLQTIVSIDADQLNYPQDQDFWQHLHATPATDHIQHCAIDAPFLMMFTSGTTGPAKAVPVPLKAIAAFKAYMLYAIDLTSADRFWNLADPGWAYGLYYGITAPLSLGHAIILNEKPFSLDNALYTLKNIRSPIWPARRPPTGCCLHLKNNLTYQSNSIYASPVVRENRSPQRSFIGLNAVWGLIFMINMVRLNWVW
jgi:acetyl-CoA synthetase